MAEQDHHDIVDALQSLADGQEHEYVPDVSPQTEPAAIRPAAPEPIRKIIPAHPEPPSLHRQRTLIPILLTCSVLLWVFATLRFVVHDDSPLSQLPMWGSIVGYIGGVLLLMVAIANMLNVKYLSQPQPRKK
jgi:hypothetical protein